MWKKKTKQNKKTKKKGENMTMPIISTIRSFGFVRV